MQAEFTRISLNF